MKTSTQATMIINSLVKSIGITFGEAVYVLRNGKYKNGIEKNDDDLNSLIYYNDKLVFKGRFLLGSSTSHLEIAHLSKDWMDKVIELHVLEERKEKQIEETKEKENFSISTEFF